MKKILSALLCLGLLCGCSENDSSKPSESNVKKELVFVDSGYSQDEDLGYLNYGVLIKNPTNQLVQYPVYSITLYDKDGKIISSEEQTLTGISANDTVAFGTSVDSKGKKVDKIEFKSKVADDDFTNNEFVKSTDFVISNVNTIDASFTGEVENNSEKDFSQVALTLILKKDGKIIYGDTNYIENLKSKDKSPFEINEYIIPQYDTYEIYAIAW